MGEKLERAAWLQVLQDRSHGRIIVPSERGIEPSPWVPSKYQAQERVVEGLKKGYFSKEEALFLRVTIEASGLPKKHWTDGLIYLQHWGAGALTLGDLLRAYDELVEESVEAELDPDPYAPSPRKLH